MTHTTTFDSSERRHPDDRRHVPRGGRRFHAGTPDDPGELGPEQRGRQEGRLAENGHGKLGALRGEFEAQFDLAEGRGPGGGAGPPVRVDAEGRPGDIVPRDGSTILPRSTIRN